MIARVSMSIVVVVLTVSLLHGCTARTTPRSGMADRITLHLYFDADGSEIDERDFERLEGAIALIRTYPHARVIVEGHTDNVGSRERNHDLSHRRAEAVKRYLVKNGEIEASRIETIGYGETRPLASNSTPEGKRINRRVEILMLR